MTDLINGRTPEVIKRNLDYLVLCETCPQNHEYGCDYENRTKECQTVDDALALIEHLESERDAALAKVPRWISVKERLPEKRDIYLAHIVHHHCKNDSYWCVCVEYYNPEDGWTSLSDLYEVTHWMPMPSKPKEGE